MEYTKWFIIFLAELRELVIRIMYSTSILIALAILSLMANNSVSEAIVQLAKALEDNIYYPSLQKYIAEIACIFLEGITLAPIITIRIKEEKEALRHR